MRKNKKKLELIFFAILLGVLIPTGIFLDKYYQEHGSQIRSSVITVPGYTATQPELQAEVLLETVEIPSEISVIPSEEFRELSADAPTNCIELRNQIATNPREGQWLAMKLRCGRMTLGDVLFFVRDIIAFIFNIIGTLGLLAIMRAGFIYIRSSDKDSGEGMKAIQAAVLGIIVAFSAFTISRIIFHVLHTT